MEEAAALGFPTSLMRAALACYGAARYIRLGPHTAAPRFASRGVVAGCSLATTLVKLYLLRRLDQFVLRHPRVDMNVFIDDFGLATSGTAERSTKDLTAALVDLEEELRLVGCGLSATKTQIVATEPRMANECGGFSAWRRCKQGGRRCSSERILHHEQVGRGGSEGVKLRSAFAP